MFQIYVKVEGLTPILMHNPQGMKGREIGTRQIPTPEEEAELSAYRLEDGRLYMQSIAFRASIINAAGPYKIGRISLKSQFSGMIRAMEPEEFLILQRNGDAITEYAIDTRRVVVQGQGIMRSRARIDLPWGVSWKMWLDETLIQKNQLSVVKDVIDRAGSVQGIGNFRPGAPKNKTGWFGKYRVVEFKEIKE